MAELTHANFNDHNKNCRVRMVQSSFDEIQQTAKDNGSSVDEEMKKQGYKDYNDFVKKKCPQFSMTCWPEEFAELGSGFVLYFHFIAFLAFILVVVMGLSVPAISAYSKENWANGWYWHEWQNGWSDNEDACDCSGKSLTKAGFPANYGKTCDYHDVDLCFATFGKKIPFNEAAKWCCTKWCYASKQCQAPESSPAYLRNVHVKGMVRATSPCKQDPVYVNAKCAGMADKAYNEADVEKVPANFIDQGIFGKMSPGNYGPDQADGKFLPLMFFVTVVVISVLSLCMTQYQIYVDAKVDAGTTSPNDFAILVTGLPATATDESAIKKFFEDNAQRDKSTEIVKVVIGWDFGEYREKMKALRELREKLKPLDPTDPEYKSTQQQIVEINQDIMACAPDRAAKLRSTGLVVVVFRYQTDMRMCLRRWTSFWARWTYSDAEDCCCVPSICKGSQLPLFPIGDPPVPVHKLRVQRAANPGDIHWEELGKSTEETAWLFAKTNGIMAGVILVCFGFTYGLNYAQATLKGEQSKKTGDESTSWTFLAFLPGFGIAFVNAVIMVLSRILGDKEFHETWTSQEFSQGAKMAFALLINTAFLVVFSNMQPKEWYESGGLLEQVVIVLGVDAIMPPLVFYLDMKYHIKRCRNRLSQDKIDDWNTRKGEIIAMPAGKDKTLGEKQLKAEIESFKRVYEPSEMDYPRRYANALNTFFCAILFAPVCPLIPIFGVIGLTLQYWCDKRLLLRWYKRPKRPYNALLAQWSLKMVRFIAPLGLSLSFFFFLTPSWEDKGEVFYFFLLSLIVSGVMIFVPSTFLRTVLGLRVACSAQSFVVAEGDPDEDYYQAQHTWSPEMRYHKDHFLYKVLPEDKNPTFFTEGADTGLKVDDMKACGASEAFAIGAAGSGGATSAVALKGGRVMEAGTWGAGIETAASASAPSGISPAPVAYGVSSAPPPEPVPTPAEEEPIPAPVPVAPTPVAPTPAPPAASEPAPTPYAPSAAAAASDGKPVWEFQVSHGWTPFNDDCQEYVEKRYQDYLRNKGKGKGKGKVKGAHINVQTCGKKVEVDFAEMTQEMGHKTRSIRRNDR